MALLREYTNNELNYFRICHVTTNVLPKALKTVFKHEWNARYQVSHGPWINCSKNATDFFNGESKGNQKRLEREPLKIIRNGNIDEWDCSCLFFAILNSTSIGDTLSHSVKKWVESLRDFRNKYSHKSEGRVSDSEFQKSVQVVIDAFNALCLDASELEEIKNEKTFTTQELNDIKNNLEKEMKAKQLIEKLLEETSAKQVSFRSLPPKPSHEIFLRKNDVSTVLQKMKEMEQGNDEEVSVIYLSGNPGCGKSQLAAQVAEAYFTNEEETDPTFVMTLDARDSDTLLESYTNFARLLGCTEFALSNCQSKCQTNDEKLIFLRSLVMSKVPRFFRWLIIVDNVTDVKVFSKYWPQPGAKEWGKGQVIVTTQDSRSVPLSYSQSQHISLSRGMEPGDACKLLCNICNVPVDSCTRAMELATKLDCQPLALASAAIYIKYTEISFEQCLEKLLKGEREPTEEVFESMDLTYGRSMASAVKLAVQNQIENEDVLKHAFQFLSLLAPAKIPVEYVARYVLLQLPAADENVIKSKILKSSLVLNVNKQSQEIKIHQIVHSVLKVYFRPEEPPSSACVLAFKSLVGCDLQELDVLVGTGSLVPHFCCLFPTLEDFLDGLSSIEYDEIKNCVSVFGQICWRHGELQLASQYHQKDLLMRKTIYGNDHPEVATSLNCLGTVFSDLGQHQKAKDCFEQALRIYRAEYGNDHPEVATSLNSLGKLYSDLGQHQKAKDCFEQALRIYRAEYGNDHPEVATSLNSLGTVCSDLGQHKKAKDCFEQALRIYRAEYFGNDHPDVATPLNSLGKLYSDLGQHQKAKDCFEQALRIYRAEYGNDHPEVATSLNSLGTVCSDLGQHQKAKDCFEQALRIYRAEYFGNDHPDVATSLNSLGKLYSDLGQHQKAKDCFEQALRIYRAEYGNDHPEVATSLNSLGTVCSDLGQHQEAKDSFEQALRICQVVYGNDHPKVATSLKRPWSTSTSQKFL